MANPTLYDNFTRVKNWAVEKFADKETLANTLSDVAFSGDYNDLSNTPDLTSYASKSDLNSYVSKTELSAAGYITAIPAEYITDAELSAMSYASQEYVQQAIADIPGVDLSAYVTKEMLSAQSYVTTTALESMAYATTTYVMDKVNAIIDGAPAALDTLNELAAAINDDASFASTVTTALGNKANAADVYSKTDIEGMAYITMDNVSACGYLTSIPSEYITDSELSSMGYLTSIPSEYITDSELSAMGYISSIPAEYITETELSGCGYVTALTQNEMDTLFPLSNS